MNNLAGQTIKGYDLQERIGAGGFGAVYRAVQSTVGREVAVKIILPGLANKPDFIRRFESEAHLIARLEHPYIVPLYDYWRDPDGAYLVMRWLRGGNLHEMLKSQGGFSVEETVAMMEQITQALHTAHRSQVIHRDIKPANILLDDDGNAYLADFGIAKDHTISKSITEPDVMIGSPDYLAPEQARSEPVTPQTDIYSLGVVLYEMLVGEHPFPNLSPIEQIFKHLNETLPDITSLDDSIRNEVNNVVQKATAKNPKERFSDVMELAQALRNATRLGITPATPSVVELLTPREQEILQLMIAGKTTREIAEKLVVEVSTVKWYNKQIYRKLNVRSRVQAIIKARELELVLGKSNAPNVTTDNLPEPENPYKGLNAFQAADAQDFFGREKLIQKILTRLQEDVQYKRFLALVGPSGSGKSSVVRAGLVPALWRGDIPASDKWYIVDMLPGERPLDELEVALLRVADDNRLNINDQLKRDTHGLIRAANLILPDDGSELLIIIDQFEEVFTLVENEDERVHFLNLLREAVSKERSRIRIIVTLRADYYDRPLQYPEFGALLQTRVETVLPLGASDLERAIREPALREGVRFEDGLVSRIVTDVNYQPGALPLLQYALTELFEQRNNRLLTIEAYEAIGGTGGALAKRADEIYLEGNPIGRELVRQLFLRLVTLGEGAEDTRRRVERAELLAIAQAGITRHGTIESDDSVLSEMKVEMMDEIIDIYVGSRLLSLDYDPATRRPTVEVSHEAILREWDRLRQWLNYSRDDIRQQRIVAQSAADWNQHKRDKSYLLRGVRLEQAETWYQSSELHLTQLESDYIAASIRQRKYETELEIARVQEKEAQENRSRNLLRALVAVFALATILSGGFGLFALAQRNNAVAAQQETVTALDLAQRSGMAFAANAALEIEEIDLAVALALESVGDDEANMLPETLRILERIENQAGPRIWRNRGGFDCSPQFSRDYRYFIWSNCQTGISVWDSLTAEKLIEMDMPEPFDFSKYFLAAFSRDGTRLLLAQLDAFPGIYHIAILDIATREIIATYTLEEPVSWVYFAADSSIIATMEILPENLAIAQEAGKHIGDSISLRDVATGAIIRQYRFENQWIQDFDLSFDGRLGVVNGWSGWDGPISDDYRAIVFDMETGDVLHTFDRPHNENFPQTSWSSAWAGFNADGTKLFMSGFPNYLIDIATGEDYSAISQLEGNPINSPDMDFQYVMNQAFDFRPQLFNIETGELQEFDVNFAYLAAESGTMLTADLGRMDEFQIWDITGRRSNTDNIRQRGAVSGVKYSPDGRYLAVANSGWGCGDTGNQDNAIYDAETLEVVGHLDGDRNMAWALDWSPDSRYIATGTYHEAILWDAATGAEIRRFTSEQDCVLRLQFSHDGRYLYGAHGSWFPDTRYDIPPYLIQWDVETGEEVRRFEFPVDKTPNWGIISLRLHPTRNIALVGIGLQFNEGCEQGSCDFVSYILNLDTGDMTEIAAPMTNGWFVGDGNEVIGIGLPNIIYVVDGETGEVLRQWQALDSQLFGTAVSPDGRYFLTGAGALAFESDISLWDIATGALIRRYFSEGQQTFIINIDFHPDRTRFVSSAFEPVIRFWDVDTQSTLDWVRENRVVRDFTCIEREQYRIEPVCAEE